MSQLHPIPVSELHQNVFTAIGKEWMLITAETEKDGKPTANTMTASWGGLLRQAFDDPLAYWHLTLFPGLALFIAVLAFNFTGEGLRKALFPR